nr:PREDICTED: uncharacterized protein LOC106702312 [Latimeria chalumnae]|eukprot:XP_014339950.1 PREDICTED: uncharacterized protein LOC106702312 [Latimeria chalumnae]
MRCNLCQTEGHYYINCPHSVKNQVTTITEEEYKLIKGDTAATVSVSADFSGKEPEVAVSGNSGKPENPVCVNNNSEESLPQQNGEDSISSLKPLEVTLEGLQACQQQIPKMALSQDQTPLESGNAAENRTADGAEQSAEPAVFWGELAAPSGEI